MTLEFKAILFINLISVSAILFCMLKILPRLISGAHDKNAQLKFRISELELLNCELQNQVTSSVAKNETLIISIENLEQNSKQLTSLQDDYLKTIESQKTELLEKQRYLENCWKKIRVLEASTGITHRRR
ncbi:TPA: hypothetical protein NJ529_004584 [Vibrio parahaemolyticus]|nr:hypothetical protein [Vibrio parahaemolyticus]